MIIEIIKQGKSLYRDGNKLGKKKSKIMRTAPSNLSFEKNNISALNISKKHLKEHNKN